MSKAKERILCVDDEPQILEAFSVYLQRRYDLRTCDSGAEALELLDADPNFAVVMSDLAMPGMDGAAFLAQVRDRVPDATRILLTGHKDMESATAAVNEGQVFRFLTKPCPMPTLVAAVEAGIRQHHLVTAERVLLQQTVGGCIRALTDLLALTNPLAFGRASRVKRVALDVARRLGIVVLWKLEAAASLSQLGCVTLPDDLVEKIFRGETLSAREAQLATKIPAVTDQMLAHIPRLEAVRAIIAGSREMWDEIPFDPTCSESEIRRKAQVLKAAMDFDVLAEGDLDPRQAIAQMRAMGSAYAPEILAALEAACCGEGAQDRVARLRVDELTVGMTLAEDATTPAGTVVVARGYQITPGLLARIHNFRPGTLKEPLVIQVAAG